MLQGQFNSTGLGADLYNEAIEYGKGHILSEHIATWLYIENSGMSIIDELCSSFETVEILEHYNDYYKLRVPRGNKTIGYLFGLVESSKEKFSISEYSVSQTTLEQIF